MSALRTAGYVSGTDQRAGQDGYEITAKGNRLAGASLCPISKGTAERILQGFVEQLRMVNSHPGFLLTITAALIFGSAVSETARLGDVDVAVRLERKPMNWETFVRLSNARVILAVRKGKRFRNIAEQVCWPSLEILHFLKSGTRQLSIHDLDELKQFRKVKCKVLFGERRALAELLPNAELLQ